MEEGEEAKALVAVAAALPAGRSALPVELGDGRRARAASQPEAAAPRTGLEPGRRPWALVARSKASVHAGVAPCGRCVPGGCAAAAGRPPAQEVQPRRGRGGREAGDRLRSSSRCEGTAVCGDAVRMRRNVTVERARTLHRLLA